MSARIGVDVGGTNCDAVVVRGQAEVLGWAKVVTAEDVTSSVITSINEALHTAGLGTEAVQAVMLGTTHFVNACIQQKGLARVAVIRLCGPATHALPPFCDFPPKLREAVSGYYAFVSGGYEYDGRAEIGPIDRADISGAVAEIVRRGIRAVVVSGVFSPVNDQHEEAVGKLLADEFRKYPGVGRPDVCLSHRVGQLGLLERENAAILNAALLPLARRVVAHCEQGLREAGIAAPLFLTANDGTLMSAADALQMPVSTFQSGPVNSLRGAAALCGIRNGVVVDIGGTTTDVGVLMDGLPRPAPQAVKFAGVTTNFQMPDVFSIGLGGGSLIHWHLGSAADLEIRQAQQAPLLTAHAAGPGVAAGGDGWEKQEAGEPDVEEGGGIGGVECYEACTVGPDSVGNQLVDRALCMGGDTPTATDVAVLMGRMEGLGDAALVEQQLPPERAQQAWHAMQRTLEWCVDHAKSQRGDVPVVVVGGGAPMCGRTLAGATRVLSPSHAAVANAIGAAIPQVSSSVDAVWDLGPSSESRHSVLQRAEQLAVRKAVQAGAIPTSCQVAVREEVPLAYLPGNTVRIRVKVIGDLDLQSLHQPPLGHAAPPACETDHAAATAATDATSGGDTATCPPDTQTSQGVAGAVSAAALPAPPTDAVTQARARAMHRHTLESGARGEHATAALVAAAATAGAIAAADAEEEAEGGAAPAPAPFPGRGDGVDTADLAAWEPQVHAHGEWVLQEPDLHLLAIGTGILGTGGGGSPGKAKLKALMQLQRAGAGSMRVVHPSSIPEGGLVVDGGYMGAPTVGIEKLDSDQAERAVQAALRAYRADSLRDGGAAEAAALMCGEVGGGNGIEPLVIGSRLGLSVVDGDLMGRAFPELQMTTAAIYGLPLTPAALSDEKGNEVTVQSVRSAAWLERLLRPLCTEMGCSAGFASRPLTGGQLRQVLVPHSLSLAWRLGHAVAAAQHAKRDAGSAIAEAAGGRVLFTGKVVDVERNTCAGFARGCLTLESSGGPTNARGSEAGVQAWAEGSQPARRELRILFQNENLVAVVEGACVASVPDLICCVEAENGMPISTEEMRYGLRVTVVGIPAHPLLTTPEALAVVGPAAFGYPDVQYKPLGQYTPVQPIPRAAQ